MPANAINPEPLKQAMKEMGVRAPLGEIRRPAAHGVQRVGACRAEERNWFLIDRRLYRARASKGGVGFHHWRCPPFL